MGAAAAAAGAWLRERERLRAERAELQGECESLVGRLARLQARPWARVVVGSETRGSGRCETSMSAGQASSAP